MKADGAGEHEPFEIPSLADKILKGIPMRDVADVPAR